MSAAAGDLVGRDRELAALERALNAGGAGFRAVVGEPVIGKTSVLERLPVQAAERGRLGPLDPEAAAELLAAIREPSVRDAVFRISGGNPFYLSQLARMAVRQRAQGDSRAVDTLTLGIPQSVMSMLAEEVRSLPPRSRRVLEAAAVAGEPFEPRRGRDRRGLRG